MRTHEMPGLVGVILRRPDVEGLVGLSYSTIRRKENAGQFPRRVRLGTNSVGWRKSEIMEWLNGLETVVTPEGADHE